MAEGISAYTANKLLDCIGNNSTFIGVTTCYIQLHTAAPGASGTTAVATETTRKAVSFGAASGGTISNDAVVEWTSIAGSEDATHYTLWDASTAGNFLGSGTITAPAYTAGDTYTIAVGDIDLAFTVAS
jgi:hypothetical protein